MLSEISNCVKEWFSERNLTHAVVGYSGGVDSTVTALLLNHAGIKVALVVAETNYTPRYSSPLGGYTGAILIQRMFGLETPVKHHRFTGTFSTYDTTFHEAAYPIMRNAMFYGEAAYLRSLGHATIVVGTANFSEAAYLGFWGKASDGAQDFYPISHLSKMQVYHLAKELNVPDEIIDAVPSGDLFYEQTNDQKMIGANYDQIEKVIAAADEYIKIREGSWGEDLSFWCNTINQMILATNDPKLFCQNIVKNDFKYQLPFPGFHLDKRLEYFRTIAYPTVLFEARRFLNV